MRGSDHRDAGETSPASLSVMQLLRDEHRLIAIMYCREELGLGIHLYWHMQFCSSACMTAYQQRLAPETKVKICRLDVLRLETRQR